MLLLKLKTIHTDYYYGIRCEQLLEFNAFRRKMTNYVHLKFQLSETFRAEAFDAGKTRIYSLLEKYAALFRESAQQEQTAVARPLSPRSVLIAAGDNARLWEAADKDKGAPAAAAANSSSSSNNSKPAAAGKVEMDPAAAAAENDAHAREEKELEAAAAATATSLASMLAKMERLRHATHTNSPASAGITADVADRQSPTSATIAEATESSTAEDDAVLAAVAAAAAVSAPAPAPAALAPTAAAPAPSAKAAPAPAAPGGGGVEGSVEAGPDVDVDAMAAAAFDEAAAEAAVKDEDEYLIGGGEPLLDECCSEPDDDDVTPPLPEAADKAASPYDAATIDAAVGAV